MMFNDFMNFFQVQDAILLLLKRDYLIITQLTQLFLLIGLFHYINQELEIVQVIISIDGSYGDWAILRLPQSIMLTRYRIYQRTDYPLCSP
jgi:hypothetical protein